MSAVTTVRDGSAPPDGPIARRAPALEVAPDGAAEDVERLWYEVYVEELGVDHPCADDRTRRVHDAFAGRGRLAVARGTDGRVAGTCLVLRGGADNALDFYARLFELDPTDSGVSVTTKMVVASSARRSRLAFELACDAYRYGLRSGIHTDFADCQPSRLPFFKRLGYRVVPGASDHPYYG
ncbi:MAG: hypothetical protein AAFP86_18275, partial [Planctomycetota bacterium]